MNFSRFKKIFFLYLSRLPMKGHIWRPTILKWGGVYIKNIEGVFIGADVTFDTNYPEDIIIERGVRITTRCIILTHFLDPIKGTYYRGKVHIKPNAHIGANTIICKPVTIGENAVVGAGSIVTKDIPDNEVWAGNPARYIRTRNLCDVDH